MKLFRVAFFVGLTGFLLVACAKLSPPMSPIESPIPTVRPTTPMYTIYSTTLTLQNGYILPMECWRYSWGEEECRATFPNGNVMDYAADNFDWSPDGKFAIRRCVRSTHDSSCLDGDQIWDMTTGVDLKFLTSYSWSQWVSTEPHTLGFVSSYIWNYNNVETLVYWNAATGVETRPTSCPDWIGRQTHRLVQAACAKLSGLLTPTVP
jgi:hypothetical protein